MLAALSAGFLVVPLLPAYGTGYKDAVAFFELINNQLSRLTPNLAVDCVIDPVAIWMPPAKLATMVPDSKARSCGSVMMRTMPVA